ncbi:MAG: hypothetical protein KIT33_10415 [Candidatus Kapabacteria bacterium]|nr:hypothetical protein [Ignavibacteriota bacterium]MCW5885372.1 hypothetical protein [Candidatus Kapabacteria bacterium]
MNSKLQNSANLELESGLTPAIKKTGSFAMIPDHYWNKKWYLKPNYHIIFNYLIYQAKWAKGGLSIGKISIGTYELSQKLNVPQKTVHRILKYLETQGEISLTPTSKFTIVTVNHLLKNDLQNEKNDLQNEKNDLQNDVVNNDISIAYNNDENGMTYKTEKMTYKTKKMTTPIDTIDIDNNINEKNIFVEDNNVIEKGKRMKKKEEAKAAPQIIEPNSVKAKSLNAMVLDIWMEEYQLNKNFLWPVKYGRDNKAVKHLLDYFKQSKPEMSEEELTEYLRQLFKDALSIKDKYIRPDSLLTMFSKLGNILENLNANKKNTSSSVGQANGKGNYNLTFDNV